jgi:hypothetical protein
MQSRTGRGVSSLAADDDVKTHLHGLYYQGLYGDSDQDHLASVVDSLSANHPEQLSAWRQCGALHMTPADAMRQYLLCLYEVVPYWKYDQYL